MKTKLKGYQRKGVKAIHAFKGKVLLADDMGLGKSIQALAWTFLTRNYRKKKNLGPVIIVCPSLLKYNWENEIKKHIGLRSEILSSRKSFRRKPAVQHPYYIINYDILDAWVDWLVLLNPSTVIFDELHFLKNPSTVRFKAAVKLAEVCRFRIGLSGTPIENRPIEIFAPLKLINHRIFTNKFHFGQRYCNVTWKRWGWDYSGASNTKELNRILLKKVMIRRLKKDVLHELPAKTREIIPIEINPADYREYKRADNDFLQWLAQIDLHKANKAKKAAAIVKIGYLIRLVLDYKIEKCIEWLELFVQNNPDEKIVVSLTHKKVLQILVEKYKKKCVWIDGSLSAEKKNQANKIFQNNPEIKFAFVQIKSGGMGINLTAASYLVFFELFPVPAKVFQMEDRIHRIGQHKPSFIYYLVTKGTIEEDICKIIEKKQKSIDQIIDNESSNMNIYQQLLAIKKKERYGTKTKRQRTR